MPPTDRQSAPRVEDSGWSGVGGWNGDGDGDGVEWSGVEWSGVLGAWDGGVFTSGELVGLFVSEEGLLGE